MCVMNPLDIIIIVDADPKIRSYMNRVVGNISCVIHTYIMNTTIVAHKIGGLTGCYVSLPSVY